jgi:hypothetical protein
MSDVLTQTEDQSANLQGDELALLKQRARMMGIEFSNNISLAKLRERVQARMEGEDESNSEQPVQANPLAGETQPPAKKRSLRQMLVEKQMKLVRLRITNLDPKKKDLPGEIITVANEYLGTVRKFVPYGEVTDSGYHVPYCLYRYLDNRKFLNIRTSKRNGREHVEQTWAKEFALEVMPQLSKEELARLANAQAAAGSVGD